MTGKAKGFTLIEVVVSIAVLSVMAGCLYPFLVTALDCWLLIRDETDLVYESRQALNLMEREIRQATDILVASSTSLSFNNVKDETVSFSRADERLLVSKGSTENALLSEHLADGDGGLVFTYLDADGNTTDQADDIRSVNIQMSLELGESTPTVASTVRIRNL